MEVFDFERSEKCQLDLAEKSDRRTKGYKSSAELKMSNHQKEVERNFEKFKEILPEILPSSQNKYALLRHAELVNIYDTFDDAFSTAQSFYADGLYSIQPITDRPIDLGLRSRAMHRG